jgi:hypothetical protein
MSGALDAETYSAQKTALVVRGLTSTQGPAPHFIVNRRGDIIVGPGIDGETSVLFAYADTGIFIAVESALAIAREDHAARRFDRIVELPLASVQLITLGVLVNKLMTALGSSVPATFYDNLSATAAGFTYGWVDTLEGVSPYNFRQRPKPAPHPALRFDYSTSTGPDFFSSVVLAQGSFNLATDIWRPLAAPRPIAGREEVRAALGSVDTAGAESVYMGNYATLAAGERSSEMQTTQRAQMFVQRMRVSHTGADEAATQAANATETGTSTVLPNEEPANVGPHTYDFATGRWGDNSPF